jgi:predicted molibdopterin-dependent oxidoreductase YjgC
LCDQGRLSFHTLERWPRLVTASVDGQPVSSAEALTAAHNRFNTIRQSHGDNAMGALGSATNTNEALFLMKKYFKDRVDFRIGREVETFRQMEDDLLRRLDKHPNTHGAVDLGLAGELGGASGLSARATSKELRAVWISFHPQLVGDDAEQSIANLRTLIAEAEFSVVSTTHDFDWARKANIVIPMAAWAEEKGTYTNYAGRVQISSRAVLPPGDAMPLHVMMVELLKLSNVQVTKDPEAIFEWIAREIPVYDGLDYDSIGPLGAMPVARAETQEVLR